jgi:hypothetical protein
MNLLSIGTIGVASALAIGGISSQVSAYKGDIRAVGPYHTEEREIEMGDIMNRNDFEGWQELMSEDGRTPGVLRKVDTQEKFDVFSKIYQLKKDGNFDEAEALRAELGLGQGGGMGQGKGMGGGRGMMKGDCPNR